MLFIGVLVLLVANGDGCVIVEVAGCRGCREWVVGVYRFLVVKGKGMNRKANVVVDVLSRKERDKPLRVQALVMTIDLILPKKILNAQAEAMQA
nr:reverse transcriptase domain-containing protein [Tanacetum cinerariifolium]